MRSKFITAACLAAFCAVSLARNSMGGSASTETVYPVPSTASQEFVASPSTLPSTVVSEPVVEVPVQAIRPESCPQRLRYCRDGGGRR